MLFIFLHNKSHLPCREYLCHNAAISMEKVFQLMWIEVVKNPRNQIHLQNEMICFIF